MRGHAGSRWQKHASLGRRGSASGVRQDDCAFSLHADGAVPHGVLNPERQRPPPRQDAITRWSEWGRNNRKSAQANDGLSFADGTAMRMAPNGQRGSQRLQPVQPGTSCRCARLTPCALCRLNTLGGHTATHQPQPVHRSGSTTGKGARSRLIPPPRPEHGRSTPPMGKARRAAHNRLWSTEKAFEQRATDRAFNYAIKL